MKTYTRPTTQTRSNSGRVDNRRQDAPRESSRPNNNVRVNPREMHQKYLTLARESIQSGNIIEAEKFYQHAEHYYRIFNERAAAPIVERGPISSPERPSIAVTEHVPPISNMEHPPIVDPELAPTATPEYTAPISGVTS
jgi:hypothetical protein